MYQYGEKVIVGLREDAVHTARLHRMVLRKKPPYGGGVRRP
jgi:hypothetical protein